MTAKPTKTQRIARDRAFYHLFATSVDFDSHLAAQVEAQVPDAWHTLEMDLDVEEPKEKVTLYLDRSVARVFRAMGKGWQGRVNRLLATWVQLKMGEVFETREKLHKRMDEGWEAQQAEREG